MQNGFAVCVSGHRPEMLPTGSSLKMMQSLLFSEINTAVEDGADLFYLGMACGTDLWAADMILHFRRKNPHIRMVCVIPWRGRIERARGAEAYHVNALMHAADEVKILSERYYRGCFRDRNQYMVSRSRRLIALVTDIRSGTGQTIHMAERAGLEMRVISFKKAVQQNRSAPDFLETILF